MRYEAKETTTSCRYDKHLKTGSTTLKSIYTIKSKVILSVYLSADSKTLNTDKQIFKCFFHLESFMICHIYSLTLWYQRISPDELPVAVKLLNGRFQLMT